MKYKFKKKQINRIVIILLIIIFASFYLIRPLTIKFGNKYCGVITNVELSVALKGGSQHFAKYIRNDRVFTRTGAHYVNIGDYVDVYHKKYFFGNFDVVDKKSEYNYNKFLIFSELIPNNIKLVKVYIDGNLYKKINVNKIKNFGCLVRKCTQIKVLYDDKIKTIIFPNFESKNFREIR
ncbi:MAG: hypothetical protein HYR91_04060 [Flavobacteriia bacterium]|nr:hypothetical protein [Flavobacteriia bacterium]